MIKVNRNRSLSLSLSSNWETANDSDSLDLDDPLPPPTTSGASGGGGGGGNEPSQEQISMLIDMGFTPAQGRKALLETVSFPLFFSSFSISITNDEQRKKYYIIGR